MLDITITYYPSGQERHKSFSKWASMKKFTRWLDSKHITYQTEVLQ